MFKFFLITKITKITVKKNYKNYKNYKNDKETNKERDRETERLAQQLNIFLYQASIISSHWKISFLNARYNRMFLETHFIIAGHYFLTKLFRLISSLNSVEYEIGFRLEGFFFSVFFFLIHLLPKLNRLHLRSYGR